MSLYIRDSDYVENNDLKSTDNASDENKVEPRAETSIKNCSLR